MSQRIETVRSQIRLVLVDDHVIVVEGLRSVIEYQDDLHVVDTATSGEAALELVERHNPDVILLDLRIPGPSGPKLVRRLMEVSPTSQVLILTAHNDEELLLDSVAAGASAFLFKGCDTVQLFEAIRRVHGGEMLMSREFGTKLLSRFEDRNAPPGQPASDPGMNLSPRELQVLEHLVTGASNASIAEQMYVSTRTVKAYLASIFQKLDVHDRTAAAILACKYGLVELPD